MENSVPARPIDVPRRKAYIDTCDEDWRTQYRILRCMVLPPAKELRNAVDLISHLQVRLGDGKQCILVLIGATPEGVPDARTFRAVASDSNRVSATESPF